jgi:hypothetical protein
MSVKGAANVFSLLTVVDFCNVTFRNEAETEGRQNSPPCETNRGVFQKKDYFQELYHR